METTAPDPRPSAPAMLIVGVATIMIVTPLDEPWPAEMTTSHRHSEGAGAHIQLFEKGRLAHRAPLRSMQQFGSKIYHCKVKQCAAWAPQLGSPKRWRTIDGTSCWSAQTRRWRSWTRNSARAGRVRAPESYAPDLERRKPHFTACDQRARAAPRHVPCHCRNRRLQLRGGRLRRTRCAKARTLDGGRRDRVLGVGGFSIYLGRCRTRPERYRDRDSHRPTGGG